MRGKVLAQLMGVVVLGGALLVSGLLHPGVVDAQSPTATRSFSTATVPAGGELEVTVAPSDYGRFGQVVETLPAGFSYLSSEQPGIKVDGQDVAIVFLEGDTVAYKVTASTTTGVGSFSGLVLDEDEAEEQVGGQHQVTVVAASDLLGRYDDDQDGSIQRVEYLTALSHYLFDGTISRDEYLEILSLYLFGG